MENGKIAIADNLENGVGFGSTEFHVIRLFDNYIPKKFLLYYLLQQRFRTDAQRSMTGSAGQLRVPVDFLKHALIPIPPLAEQYRIISKIEGLFESLDAAKTKLDNVRRQLNQLRQSVLAFACEGELTEKWRARNPKIETAKSLLSRIIQVRKSRFEHEYEVSKREGKQKPKRNSEMKTHTSRLRFRLPFQIFGQSLLWTFLPMSQNLQALSIQNI